MSTNYLKSITLSFYFFHIAFFVKIYLFKKKITDDNVYSTLRSSSMVYLLRFYKSDILTIINFITDKHSKFKCLKIVIVNFLNIKNSFWLLLIKSRYNTFKV